VVCRAALKERPRVGGRGFKVDGVRHLKAPVSPSPLIPLFTPPLTLVQKIALTAVVNQAHNPNERPLLHGPTAKPPFGLRLTLSDRFYTPTLIRPDNGRREKAHVFQNYV